MNDTNKSLLVVAVQCKQLYDDILMGEANTVDKVDVGIRKINEANGEFQKEEFDNRIKATREVC